MSVSMSVSTRGWLGDSGVSMCGRLLVSGISMLVNGIIMGKRQDVLHVPVVVASVDLGKRHCRGD